MNHIEKTIKSQQNRIIKKIKTKGIDSFCKLLAQDSIQKATKQNLSNNRDRLYNPLKTLSMFLTQALNEDRSCQNIVNKETLKIEKKMSIITEGYCKARQRLLVEMRKKVPGTFFLLK